MIFPNNGMFIALTDLSEVTQLGSGRVGTEHRSPCDSQAPKLRKCLKNILGSSAFKKKISMGDF